jgi:hypothetical protein
VETEEELIDYSLGGNPFPHLDGLIAFFEANKGTCWFQSLV